MAGLGAGSVLALPGCGALQQLDTSAAAEGTGIQFTGLIKVLATYRASPRQQAVAQSKARRAFVDRGMRPAHAERKKKAQQKHRKQEAVVRRQTADPVKREQALAQLQQESTRELAAIDASWFQAASKLTDGAYTADFQMPTSSGRVALAPIPQSEIQIASASFVSPRMAVGVPAERAIAGAAASVMFYDTRSHQLAKNDVYVIDRTPDLGKVATFGDVSAEFVER
jgi:hypothetical protein